MRKHYLLILALFLPLLSWAEEDMAIFSELTYLSAAPGAETALESVLMENDAVVAQAQANARGLFAWALYRVLYHDGAYSHVVIRQAIQRDGLSPLAQASAAEALGVDLGSRLRGLAREEGRLVYSLEQFHTNLTLQDRPFLTAIFLASDDDEGTRDVLENRFGPALKAMIADEAGPAAYSQYRLRLPSAGGDHDRVLVLQYPTFKALGTSAPAEAAFAAAGDSLEAAEVALSEVASIVRSEHWQLVQVVTRQAEN